jgi:hypothetical protein
VNPLAHSNAERVLIGSTAGSKDSWDWLNIAKYLSALNSKRSRQNEADPHGGYLFRSDQIEPDCDSFVTTGLTFVKGLKHAMSGQ